MSWIRNSIVAVALGASAVAAAADTLVVRSSGPSAGLYPAGKSIADGATLALRPGDQITLLDGRGTRVLRGPGAFNLGGAAAGGAASSRFAALVGAAGSDRRVRIGAVRSVGATAHAPNLWYVDVALDGPVCIADPATVTLWRQRADQDQTLTVTGDHARSATLTWPAGTATLAWPAALPVAAGGYTLALSGGAAGSIRFVMLGMKPAGLEDTTAALIRNGCRNQLDTIVDTLAMPAASPSAGF